MSERAYGVLDESRIADGLQASLLSRYQAAVAVATIASMFTGIANYLFNTGMFPAPPLAWLIGLAALSVPLWFSARTWRVVLTSPLVGWCTGYILIVVLSFLWSTRSGVAVQDIRTAIVTVLAIPLFIAIFGSPNAVRAARKAVMAAVIIAIAVNFYEVLNPGRINVGTFGRAAGFYQNANQSAGALNIGLVLSIHIVRPRFRALYAVLVGLGVLVTLSRGGLLCAALAMVYLMGTGTIRAHRIALAVMLASAALAGGIVVSGQTRRLTELLQMGERSGILARITDPQVAIQGADASTNLRAEVALKAWEMFKERPFLGWGVGSTTEWALSHGTHDMYLKMLAEYGILGLLMYPLLLYAAIYGATGKVREVGRAFLLIMVPLGFFSHNQLDNWEIVVGMSLMAAMATMSSSNSEDASAVRA
jgi:O-antigen ligase